MLILYCSAMRNHVGKVTCDVGGSTEQVFTKRTCKDQVKCPLQKKVKQCCRTILKLEEKMSFSPHRGTSAYVTRDLSNVIT